MSRTYRLIIWLLGCLLNLRWLPAPPIELSDIDPLVEYVEFLLDLEFTSHAF